MATDKKDFNLNIAPVWKTQNGNMMSLKINDEIYDALQRVEKGGKLFIKQFDAEFKSTKGEKFPDGYIEYMSPDKVKQFADNAKTRGNPRQSAHTDDAI